MKKQTKAGTTRVEQAINSIIEPMFNEGIKAVNSIQVELLRLVKEEHPLSVIAGIEALSDKYETAKAKEEATHRKIVYDMVLRLLDDTLKQAKAIAKKQGEELPVATSAASGSKKTAYQTAKSAILKIANNDKITDAQFEKLIEAAREARNA